MTTEHPPEPAMVELAQRLQLERPLVFPDVESTQPFEGARPKPEADRIVSFGAVKLLPDGSRRAFHQLVNPLQPITKSSTEIHKITDDMVKDAPTWKDCGPGVVRALKGCDVCGYGVQYDIRIMRAECQRANIYEPEPDEKRSRPSTRPRSRTSSRSGIWPGRSGNIRAANTTRRIRPMGIRRPWSTC